VRQQGRQGVGGCALGQQVDARPARAVADAVAQQELAHERHVEVLHERQHVRRDACARALSCSARRAWRQRAGGGMLHRMRGAGRGGAGRAGEGAREAQRLGGERAKGGDGDDAVRVEAKEVRLVGVQVGRLDQRRRAVLRALPPVGQPARRARPELRRPASLTFLCIAGQAEPGRPRARYATTLQRSPPRSASASPWWHTCLQARRGSRGQAATGRPWAPSVVESRAG